MRHFLIDAPIEQLALISLCAGITAAELYDGNYMLVIEIAWGAMSTAILSVAAYHAWENGFNKRAFGWAIFGSSILFLHIVYYHSPDYLWAFVSLVAIAGYQATIMYIARENYRLHQRNNHICDQSHCKNCSLRKGCPVHENTDIDSVGISNQQNRRKADQNRV